MEEGGNKKEPKKLSKGKGTDTFFRITLANQIELISLADQKANIIIGINTFIISIILVLGSGVQKTVIFTSLTPEVYLPLLLLLAFCLVSGVFSIFAARPVKPVIKKGKQGVLYSQKEGNTDIDKYLNELKEMLRSKEKIIENLGTDMFYQEMAINRKFRLLRFSYFCFLAGLVVAVLLFLFFKVF
jgi:hypothetical protein